MMRRIVGSSLKFRGLVLALAAAVMVLGVVQLREMPRDVLPEFGQPTVEVQTEALGLAAPEVEQLITVPLEQDLLNGVPFVDTIQSESVAGLSSIQIVFKKGTPVARARQVVTERLTQAAGIPNVAKPPQMVQPLSSTSRLMMVGLSSSRLSLIDMGVLARWTIRPRLLGVAGVANVSIWGQRERQLQVQVDPKQLAREGVSLEQVISTTGNALWWSPLGRLEANTPGTGGFFDGPTQRLGIFHESPIKTPENLAQVPLDTAATEGAAPGTGEAPPRLGDVVKVVEDHQPLIGDSVLRSGPGLLLVIEKLPGANVVEVTRGVDKALNELAPGLAGVKIDRSIYRPATYVQHSTNNLLAALMVGVGLLVLLLVLFDWRSAIVAALAITAALLAALLVLGLRGETINAMVLAGLAAAVLVLVDDVIGDTESIGRRRRQRTDSSETSNTGIIGDAVLEMRRPLAYATVIALLVLLPIIVLKGESGAFLPALAFSYAVAVITSIVVALTVTPALSALLLPGGRAGRSEPTVARALRHGYDRVAARLLHSARPAYALLALLVVAGFATLPFLDTGHSLVPSLHDSTLLVSWDGAPGTSVAEMDRISTLASRELRSVPGVRDVGAHVGRAVLGDRVVGSNSGELWVAIKGSADYDKTVAAVRGIVTAYPGVAHAVTNYPTERINEILHKPSRDLTVRIYGADLAVLRAKASEVKGLLAKVDGVKGPRVRLPAVEPGVRVEVNLDAAQRAGVKPGDVRRASAALLSGINVGALFQDQKIFDVIVWGSPSTRANLTNIRDLPIDTPGGGSVRLGDVADVRVAPVESVIQHDDISRYIDVGADVSGRDTAAVASDVRKRLEQVRFPLEHNAVVLGSYSAQSTERTRFLEVLAATAIGVFLLLQAAFGSWRLAAAAFVALPAAVTGGLLALLIDGGTLSLGSIAGLLVVFAIAARGCVVLVKRAQEIARAGDASSAQEVIQRAARERVVPIVVTVVGGILVVLPFLLFGSTPGYELSHGMAVVVVGGLVTAALVNVVVVPGLYVRVGPGPVARVGVDLPALEAEGGNGDGKVSVASATVSDA